MSDETKQKCFQFDTRDLFFMIAVATVAGLLLRVGAGRTVAMAWLVGSSLVIFMAIRARSLRRDPGIRIAARAGAIDVEKSSESRSRS